MSLFFGLVTNIDVQAIPFLLINNFVDAYLFSQLKCCPTELKVTTKFIYFVKSFTNLKDLAFGRKKTTLFRVKGGCLFMELSSFESIFSIDKRLSCDIQLCCRCAALYTPNIPYMDIILAKARFPYMC